MDTHPKLNLISKTQTTISQTPSIMVSVEPDRLSEEKVAVEYDYSSSSSSSDENDSIKTPSSRSSSPERETTMKVIGVANFIDRIPEPTANPLEVRDWIQTWFTERSLHQLYLDETIDKLYWNGQDIHNESKAILEGDLKTVGFKLYARRLALDIVEARGGEEEPQNNPSIESPQSIREKLEQIRNEQFQIRKEALERIFNKKCKTQAREQEEESARLGHFWRFIIVFSYLILAHVDLFTEGLYFTILCTGGYLICIDFRRYLHKTSFTIEDERQSQENEKRSQQRKVRDEHQVRKLSLTEEHNKKQLPVGKDNKISELPPLGLDYKKRFFDMWLNWFCVEVILVLSSLPEVFRVLNLHASTIMFLTSNEGLALLSSGVESILNK